MNESSRGKTAESGDRGVPPKPDPRAIHRRIQAIWRIDSARVIAILARLVNDVGLAEDFAQDALLAAIEQWPRDGVPDNPAAWLTTVGKRKAIDFIRRDRTAQRFSGDLIREAEILAGEDTSAAGNEYTTFRDDLLRLVFTACHPALGFEAQSALALRILCGLTVEEIARAFLVSDAAISQRIVRAKRKLAEDRIPFEIPEADELPARLQSVLEVVYLLFNEGYAATRGEHWLRADLCNDALRVGRILASLLPAEPEVHGLVALMELQASRIPARVGPDGAAILLGDQDRTAWDRLQIRRGLHALAVAEQLCADQGRPPGHVTLQAAIAACHARARAFEDTDWDAIVGLYDDLLSIGPSPVVELNRAVAVGMRDGAQAALYIVDGLQDDRRMKNYHLLPSVRGELLYQLGRVDEARVEFARAANLTENDREKELLERKAKRCTP